MRTQIMLLCCVSLFAAEPRRTYKFDDIPSPNYYSRSFTLEGLKPLKDATSADSDEVIGKNPMRLRGFKVSWLRPGQLVGAVARPTAVTMVDASGTPVKVTLKAGEPVVYDENDNILAVNRCANKVTEGKIELAKVEPPPAGSLPPAPPCCDKKVDVNLAGLSIPSQFAIQHQYGDKTVVHRYEGQRVERVVRESRQPFLKTLGGFFFNLGVGGGAFMAGKGVMDWGGNTVEAAAARQPDVFIIDGSFNPENTVNPTITSTGGQGGSTGPINVTAQGGAGGQGGRGGQGGHASSSSFSWASARARAWQRQNQTTVVNNHLPAAKKPEPPPEIEERPPTPHHPHKQPGPGPIPRPASAVFNLGRW